MEFLFRACRDAEYRPDESLVVKNLTFYNDFASTADGLQTKTHSLSDSKETNSFSNSDTFMNDLLQPLTTSRILHHLQNTVEDVICEDLSMTNNRNDSSLPRRGFRQPKRS